MARPIAKKTAVQLVTAKARDALAKAIEVHEKSKTPADAEKVKAAREAVSAALKAENRERFVKVGGQRVSRAIKALRAFGMTSNPESYVYEPAEVEKAFLALNTALAAAAAKFVEAPRGKNAEPEFSF